MKMNRVLNYIADRILAFLHREKYVWVDGLNNSVIMSHQLTKIIASSISKTDDRILFFMKKMKNGKLAYCFCTYRSLEPILDKEVQTVRLNYSKLPYHVWFVTEHVQNILNEYNLSATGISKMSVLPRNGEYTDEEGRLLYRYVYYELIPNRNQ